MPFHSAAFSLAGGPIAHQTLLLLMTGNEAFCQPRCCTQAGPGKGICDISLFQTPIILSKKNRRVKYNMLNISVLEYLKQICD